MDEVDVKNQAYIDTDLANMIKNGVTNKMWVAAGNASCQACMNNQSQGLVGVKSKFNSGHIAPLAHSGCECYLQAEEIDLESIDIWSGG